MKKYQCLLLGFLLFFSACSRNDGPISTGHVFSAADVKISLSSIATRTLPVLGDSAYEQLNSKWILSHYGQWKADLFDKGVTKWDSRFDCNRFAASFASSVQLKFYSLKFHSYTKAQAGAIGEIWYKPDNGAYHAINIIFTETGIRFFEPQNGTFIELSDKEKLSIGFIRI